MPSKGCSIGLQLSVATALMLSFPAVSNADFSISAFNTKACTGSVAPAGGCNQGTAPAGSHRAATVSMDFAGSEHVKDIVQHFPPGIIPNPENVPKCTMAQLTATNCPANSQIGTTSLTAQQELLPLPIPLTISGNVYNLEVDPPYVGGLGFITTPGLPIANALAAPFTLRSGQSTNSFLTDTLPAGLPDLSSPPIVPHDADFGLTGVSTNVPNEVEGIPIKVTHIEYTLNGVVAGKPYITLTPACLTAKAQLEAVSYETPYPPASSKVTNFSDVIESTGCDDTHPPFNPTLPNPDLETEQTDTPSGYDIAIDLPEEEAPPIGEEALDEGYLREATITLPKGTAISPSAAEGLTACSDAQLGKDINTRPTCPASSDVGDVTVESGNIPDDLHGHVYIGQPTPNDTYRLFLAFPIEENPDGSNGLWVKLKGVAKPDPVTGQITTNFNELPPVPFTKFKLSLRGGSRAVLVNPPDCGSHQITSTLTPWTAPPDFPASTDEHPTASFDTSYDGAGADCPDPRPFNPTGTLSTDPTQAGASSSLSLGLSVPDREQLLRTLRIALPPGLVGRLTGVELCSTAAASAGNCPGTTRIGSLTNTVGPGTTPLGLPGSLYLTQPFAGGDPAGMAIVVPSKVGPYDFGNVIVKARVILRSDGGLDVQLIDDLPPIIGGVPIRVRNVATNVDRANFIKNPTSCAQLQGKGIFTSTENTEVTSNTPYQATGCEALAFSPTLKLMATGETKRFGHPAIQAVVTQPPGEANIAKSRVQLPDIIRPDNVPLLKPGHICPEAAIATRSCPAASQVGTAKADTPLLPTPLSGPVYVVQRPGQVLPGLAIYLDGAASIRLDAVNTLQGFAIVNTFDAVPDVPLSRFELNIKGGTDGIIKNFQDICNSTGKANATFTSHSGKSASSQPPLEVPACAAQNASPRVSISMRKVRSGRPLLKLSAQPAPGGAKIKSLRLSLPRTLQIHPSESSAGVRVRAGARRISGKGWKLRKGKLTITKKLPKGGAKKLSVTISKGAITPKGALKSKARRGKSAKLTFKVRVVNVDKKTFNVKKKVKAKP